MDLLLTIIAYLFGFAFCLLIILYALALVFDSLRNLFVQDEPWGWLRGLFSK